MGRLDGRVAIITGAGGGIGFEYAKRFLGEGARVAIAEVDEDRCGSAAEELSALGDVEPVPTDIADEASVQASSTPCGSVSAGLTYWSTTPPSTATSTSATRASTT